MELKKLSRIGWIVLAVACLHITGYAMGQKKDTRNSAHNEKKQVEKIEESKPNLKADKKEITMNEQGEQKKEKKDKIAVIETSMGTIKFKFYSKVAPETIKNFITLAKKKFYDGLIFHRVIKGFMIQGGCPLGTGTGDPGYKIKAEFSSQKHVPGTVAMARAQSPDSAGSQFYICLAATPFLDGKYTVFGQVIEGMNIVLKIGDVQIGKNDKPLTDVVMKKVYIIE